jgi:hypothetical protein
MFSWKFSGGELTASHNLQMPPRFALVVTMLGFLCGRSKELWTRDARLVAKERNQVGACVLANFFIPRKPDG